MSRTSEQRLELLEASVLSLTQGLAALTEALQQQTLALDALASSIDQMTQESGQEMEEPVSFLGQRR